MLDYQLFNIMNTKFAPRGTVFPSIVTKDLHT